jgi:hypothetical protein
MDGRERYIAATRAPAPVSTGTPNFGPPSANTPNQTSYQDPREQGIMAAATANMPPPPTPPITQTQTGGSFGGYETPQQQLAASLLDSGQVAGNLAFGLYDKGPVIYPEDVTTEQILGADDPADVGGYRDDMYRDEYYTTYGEGAQAHSPTGLIEITGEDGIPAFIGRDEDGNLIPNPDSLANKYRVVNPFASFDQSFYGMDNFDYGFYGGGPTEVSETFSGAPWFQKGLDEILAEGPAGFGDMQSIYGEEFDPEREASFLYLTGVPQFGDETIYDYI